MTPPTVIFAGATGDLGGRIARSLVDRGASVRALVRASSAPEAVERLRKAGVEIAEVDFDRVPELREACEGGDVLVSTLSGLRETIVGVQTRLLDAAVEAGVSRFFPSDFSIAFDRLTNGENRNLDARREFAARLDEAPIAATSILNGMFADLLTGPAPVVVAPIKRVVYWGDADQPLDFTTIADTAAYTTEAILDPSTPRTLRIAGDTLSARGLADAASAASGDAFKPFRAGGIGRLNTIIAVTQKLAPGRDEVFPPWQGMQYLRDMFSGDGKLTPLDNDRYAGIEWTPVRDVLAAT